MLHVAVLAALCVRCGEDGPKSATVGGTAVVDTGGTPRVSCDPVRQDCPTGRGCTLVGNSFQCVAIVVDGAEGEACQEESECGLGLACLAATLVPACDGFKCCTPLCELEESSYACPAADKGAECAPALTGDVPAAYQNYGVCRL